jgi:hypothetical protein
MNTYERTASATAMFLATVVAAFILFSNVPWPTSWLGRAPEQTEILLYDILPDIAVRYLIGLGAIAITRFVFPKSNITVILCVVAACAALASLFLLWLSAAIGASNIRDPGGVAGLLAVPLAIATWAVMSRYRSKREVR